MGIFNSLQQAPLFTELKEEQLKAISQISQSLTCVKGQTIFSQGQPAKGFYLIAYGRVKVYKLSLEGKEQILHIFGPGEPIGEVPVFEGTNYPAHAEAFEQCQLIFLPRDKLQSLFAQNPGLALNMLAVLAKRLRIFTNMIEELTLKELPSRLATYFMQIQDARQGAETIKLDVSKGTLAKILGAKQESISRALKKMNEAGIINVEKRSVTILRADALEDLAEGFLRL